MSENNRRAKYYRWTAKGRRKLAEKTRGWDRMVAVVAKAMSAPARPGA